MWAGVIEGKKEKKPGKKVWKELYYGENMRIMNG